MPPSTDLLRVAMGRSPLDRLDQVGTKEDALKPLRQFASMGGSSAEDLALRAGQGELPALNAGGDWRTRAGAERGLGPRRVRVGQAWTAHDDLGGDANGAQGNPDPSKGLSMPR